MRILIVFLMLTIAFPGLVLSQNGETNNWFNLDLETDEVPGVSTEKAYNMLLKGKTSKPVVVAIIDSGVDYDHEDLKELMWVNEDEIPGNGIDDDANGYIDDQHGWNFLGNPDGENVNHDSYEVTRLYAALLPKYQNADPETLNKKEKKEYKLFLEYKEEVEKQQNNFKKNLDRIAGSEKMMLNAMSRIDSTLKAQNLPLSELEKMDAGEDQQLAMGKNVIQNIKGQGEDFQSINELKELLKENFVGAKNYYNNKLKFAYNPEFDPRGICRDNPDDYKETGYGNSNVEGPDAFHGTHVAGIVAASRTNDLGVMGVADNVQIMSVRAVPDGDERDKDVANAIRYAADNGAKVINMSFGKGYSPGKKYVDKAIKYAKRKDVLIVAAAGNNSTDNDVVFHYPIDTYSKSCFLGKGFNPNWISVGAVSPSSDENLVASFSNYGQHNVDIFAPGMKILSTAPNNNYQEASGTSMASPVVAGVAALIRSYFPELKAAEVKAILLASSVKLDKEVVKPGTDEKVKFSTLSSSGGLVNSYEAVKLASELKSSKKKIKKVKSSKSVVKPKDKSRA